MRRQMVSHELRGRKTKVHGSALALVSASRQYCCHCCCFSLGRVHWSGTGAGPLLWCYHLFGCDYCYDCYCFYYCCLGDCCSQEHSTLLLSAGRAVPACRAPQQTRAAQHAATSKPRHLPPNPHHHHQHPPRRRYRCPRQCQTVREREGRCRWALRRCRHGAWERPWWSGGRRCPRLRRGRRWRGNQRTCAGGEGEI